MIQQRNSFYHWKQGGVFTDTLGPLKSVFAWLGEWSPALWTTNTVFIVKLMETIPFPSPPSSLLAKTGSWCLISWLLRGHPFFTLCLHWICSSLRPLWWRGNSIRFGLILLWTSCNGLNMSESSLLLILVTFYFLKILSYLVQYFRH